MDALSVVGSILSLMSTCYKIYEFHLSTEKFRKEPRVELGAFQGDLEKVHIDYAHIRRALNADSIHATRQMRLDLEKTVTMNSKSAGERNRSAIFDVRAWRAQLSEAMSQERNSYGVTCSKGRVWLYCLALLLFKLTLLSLCLGASAVLYQYGTAHGVMGKEQQSLFDSWYRQGYFIRFQAPFGSDVVPSPAVFLIAAIVGPLAMTIIHDLNRQDYYQNAVLVVSLLIAAVVTGSKKVSLLGGLTCVLPETLLNGLLASDIIHVIFAISNEQADDGCRKSCCRKSITDCTGEKLQETDQSVDETREGTVGGQCDPCLTLRGCSLKITSDQNGFTKPLSRDKRIEP